MIVQISAQLPISADKAWEKVKESRTLLFVTRGLLGFSGENFPVEWKTGETVKTRLLLFNFIPAWNHEISFVRIDDERRELYTNEKGGLISVWNHLIKIDEKPANSCLYTDRIEIEAGLLTPIVWFFAQLFYRYRQMRWQVLAREG